MNCSERRCWTLQSQPCPVSPSDRSTACSPNACRASGRGLQPKGLRVKEVADFKVYTKGGGSGELKVSVKGPSTALNSVALFEMQLYMTNSTDVSLALQRVRRSR